MLIGATLLTSALFVQIDAGGGIAASSLARASVVANGRADIGLATSNCTDCVSPALVASAWGDTSGYAHVAGGVGIVRRPTDPSKARIRAFVLGGLTTYSLLGDSVLPMVGAEGSVAQRLGSSSSFELSLTVGAAVVFTWIADDVVDTKPLRVSSGDTAGLAAWGRLAVTYLVRPDIGFGPFFADNIARVGNDIITKSGVTSSTLVSEGIIGGVQLVIAE